MTENKSEDKKLFVVAVDDDDIICDMYKTGLVEFDVEVFDNPLIAKDFLFKSERKPDVILMDIMMPELDGISLIREIHSNDELAHIPIIAVSGLNDAASLNDAMLFGAVDYVIKPFDIEDLSNRIKKIVEKYKERRKQ